MIDVKMSCDHFQQPSLGIPDGCPLPLVFVPFLCPADWNMGDGQSCVLDHENEGNFLGTET